MLNDYMIVAAMLSPVVHEAGLLVLALEEEELYLVSEAVDLGHQPRLGAVRHLPAPAHS